MAPAIDWEALARHLSDEATPDESARVRQWLEQHPGDATVLGSLDRLIERAVALPEQPVDVEAALRAVRARIEDSRVLPLSRATRASVAVAPIRSRIWRSVAARAAAVMLAVLGGAVLLRGALQSANGGAPAAQVYVTGIGQRDSVHLPDGSLAVLGPDSRLSIPSDYGSPRRDVQLTGEALFDVRHDDAHAFSVQAGSAMVRDIGTTFSVQALEPERVRVAVSAGTVLLHHVGAAEDRGIVLHQGDVGTLQADGVSTADRGGAAPDEMSWTVGRLVFREAPLSTVGVQLRRWYGIVLKVEEPSLAARHLTASFSGEPVDQVIKVIALALGANVERSGDTVFVRRPAGVR